MLIYGENGRGKTTLAAVFRSLATGDPLPIIERQPAQRAALAARRARLRRRVTGCGVPGWRLELRESCVASVGGL